MTRILLVGKGPPDRGGIAAHLRTLGSALAVEQDVSLLNLTDPSAEPQGGRLTPANITRTVRDVRALWREAAAHDVVDIHSAMVPWVTAVRAGVLAATARLRGATVVVHAHGGELRTWLRGPLRRLALRLALPAASRIIAVAEGERAALATALGAHRVVLVENGIDPEPFASAQDRRAAAGTPRILYVGLLTPRKGVLDLIRASELLHARGVHHELVLVGGTPDEGQHAEEEVRRLAAPHVVFAGARPHEEMPGEYRRASVFCLPSWWESMPLSILEAMASGLPVVATTVGDVPRLVTDGETGLLVEPRDPGGLADALERLLVDRDLRRRFGEAGRARVLGEFHVDRMTAELSAHLDALAPTTGDRAATGSGPGTSS